MKFTDELEPIQIYLPIEDKHAFKRACFLCDTTMSRELRRFIREYTLNPPVPDRNYPHPVPYELKKKDSSE